MKRALASNIGTRGRWVRALGGAALFGAALLLYRVSFWLTAGLGLSGLFMIFEATRGWCVLRACGLKTRL